jgi:hypothetical protein
MGKTGSPRRAILILCGLALVSALVQACSDNTGPAGPSFGSGGAGQVGHADSAAQILVQVAVNPNTIELGRQAGITVLATNPNGRALPNKHVQLSTTVGTLNRVDGFTDAGGKFVAFLRITEQDAANAAGLVQATITAFVEGAVGTGTVNFGATPALTVNPAAINLGALTNVGGFCTATRSITIFGGVPPYEVSTTGPGSSIGSGNVYRVRAPIGAITDTIRVADSQGTVVTVAVTGTCN